MTTRDSDAAARFARLTRRGLSLEYVTLGWNVLGCGIVLVSAFAARSVALAGFGIDSIIEIFASVVVVWQLKAINHAQEDVAERLIGIAFLFLAAYVAVQSVAVLLMRAHPHTSPIGIIWLALTCAVMMVLAYGKGRTGTTLGNRVLQKEAKVTVVDGILAGAVLIGLLLNATLGWWWADPLAALVIVYYGLQEGALALRA